MKFRETRKQGSNENGLRNRWMIPYADLVTILLALFVVLYAASDQQRAADIASTFKGIPNGGIGILPDGDRERRHELSKDILNDPILSLESTLRETSRDVTITLPDTALFAAAEAEVAPEARRTIKRLAEKLASSKGLIRVEGHTDSTPISNQRFRSNWELSTARASSVLILLIENGVSPVRLSASGYGGFRPVGDNSTAEGRRSNRRVDIVVELKRRPMPGLVNPE